MPFDAISYLLARKALSQGIRLPTLKDLVIDADKDWQGYKIKNLGEPISPYDAARRIYVDIATTGLGINYYLLDEADAEVPAYKKMSITPPNLTEAYVEIEEDSVGDYLIQEWIAEPDGIQVIRLGVYTINFQSEIVGGGAKIRFFFRLYERESGGTENLIVESTPSNRIEKERENVVTSAVLTSDYVMATGSRLVLKLYARWEENRSATVRIYYQGAVNSRLTVPTVKEILDGIYASIIHASRHALGGPDELSLDASQIASGLLSVDRIPGLDASKIVSGVLDVARIPDLDASKITSGVFDVARIPNLDASKITSGVFVVDRIPDLLRSKITDFFSTPFWDNIPDKPSVFPPESHTHDDRYYTKTQLQTSGQSSVHWNNITNKPSTFPPDPHTHALSEITDFSSYFQVKAILVGTTASRPSPGVAYRLYISTDEQIIYLDDGAQWIPLGAAYK